MVRLSPGPPTKEAGPAESAPRPHPWRCSQSIPKGRARFRTKIRAGFPYFHTKIRKQMQAEPKRSICASFPNVFRHTTMEVCHLSMMSIASCPERIPKTFWQKEYCTTRTKSTFSPGVSRGTQGIGTHEGGDAAAHALLRRRHQRLPWVFPCFKRPTEQPFQPDVVTVGLQLVAHVGCQEKEHGGLIPIFPQCRTDFQSLRHGLQSFCCEKGRFDHELPLLKC